MTYKIFSEGGDNTGKTTNAKSLHRYASENYKKNYLQKSKLMLCSDLYENNKDVYLDRGDVFTELIDCNPPCNDSSKQKFEIIIIDRSPIIDIVLNGNKSRFYKDGLFSAIIQTNDLVIFTTNVSYEAYKSYGIKKKRKGMKTDKFDNLSYSEYTEFQNEILMTAINLGIRNYIIVDENTFNCDEPMKKIFR